MLIVETKAYEKIILQIIEAKDMKKVIAEFMKDRFFFYSVVRDISKGADSPNYFLTEKVAQNKKLDEEFIISQAKFVLSYFNLGDSGEDYYSVLGVSPSDSTEEIRRKWLELVKAYHPDKIGDEGLDITMKLNEAYEVLGDAKKRRAYNIKHLPEEEVLVKEEEKEPSRLKYGILPALAVLGMLIYIGSSFFPRSVEEKKELVKRVEKVNASPNLNSRIILPPIASAPEPASTPILEEIKETVSEVLKEEKEPIKEEVKVAALEDIKPSAPKEEMAIEKQAPEAKPVKSQITPLPVIIKEASLTPQKEDVNKEIIKKEEASKKNESDKKKELSSDFENVYVVQKGDTLWKIANSFDITAEAIRKANGLKSRRLDIGDILIIPSSSEKILSSPSEKKEVAQKEPEKSEEETFKELQELAKESDLTLDEEEKEKPISVKLEKSTPPENKKVEAKAEVKTAPPPDPNSLYSFVSDYVSTYRQRDINKFISYFEPNAKENGVLVSQALSTYRDNFHYLEIKKYDVAVKKIHIADNKGYVEGDFQVKYRKIDEQTVKNSSGTINWVLLWQNNRWRISELNYRIKDTKYGN